MMEAGVTGGPMKTEAQRIEQLEKTLAHVMGQLLASNLALGCLLRLQAEREAAATMIDREYERALTEVLNTNYPESFLDGMLTVKKRFLFASP
jgi:hypothetical protein